MIYIKAAGRRLRRFLCLRSVRNLAQNDGIKAIFNDLYKKLKEDKNIDEVILNEIFRDAQTIQKNTDNNNQKLGKVALKASIDYLHKVVKVLNEILSEKIMENHIKKIRKTSLQYFYIDTIKESLAAQMNTQSQVKTIYSATIVYQKEINNILNKEILTVFVFEQGDETKFFYSTDLEAFVDAAESMRFSSNGKISYNLTDNIAESLARNKKGNIIKTKERKGLEDHQKKLTNSYSLTKNFQTISRISDNQEISDFDAFIKDNGLDRYFYTSEGEKRQRVTITTQAFFVILDKLGLDRRNLKGLKKYFGNQYALEDLFNKAIKRAEIKGDIDRASRIKRIQEAHQGMSEKTSSFEYRFTFGEKTYKVINRGDLREAFFGAFYKLSGDGQTFLRYLQDVDNISGIFRGDFSVVSGVNDTFFQSDFEDVYPKDGRTLEVQVKSFNAGFNIPQFIKLAQEIIKLKEEKAISEYILKRVKKDNESKGNNRNKDITEIIEKEKEQLKQIMN